MGNPQPTTDAVDRPATDRERSPSAVTPLPVGEGPGVRDDALSALKGNICNALWPTYQGCMYGRSCTPDKRRRMDGYLAELLEHFGAERLVELARSIHQHMTEEGFGAPRTFLGHMQRLNTIMMQEMQSGPSAGAPASEPAAVDEPLRQIAAVFLGDIGFRKPPEIKLRTTLEVLLSLRSEGYTDDEIRLACGLAAAAGAHGPGLIPHMIGREPPAPDPSQAAASAHAEAHAQAERQAHDRWAGLARRFDELLVCERERYINEAMRTNRTISKRPPDHPLVRAAAIQLYAQETAGHSHHARDAHATAVTPLPVGEGPGVRDNSDA